MKKTTKRLTCLLLAVLTALTMLPMTYGSAAALKSGDRGSSVKTLQQNLIGLGCLTASADGSYGPKTKAAVAAFQEAFGLTADGTADDRTQAALRCAVIRVQLELHSAGHNPGSADGKFGTKTKTALKSYQKDQGLEQTGTADKATRSALFAQTGGLRTDQTLSKGGNRTQVKYLQMGLIGLGYLTGAADGSYGPMTQAAVRNYQKANGLNVDGAAGPNTLLSIKNAVMALQSDLVRLGHLSGEIDGICGKGTTAAIASYQRAQGLEATGVADAATMRKLWGFALYEGFETPEDDGPVKVYISSLYQNGDYRKFYYGKEHQFSTTVHTSGCGGVSMAMVLNALLDTDKYDGQNVMQWFADHDAYYGDGTLQSGLWAYPRELGLKSEYCDTAMELTSHLKKGRLAIAVVYDKTGDAFFCTPKTKGHFILLSGYRVEKGVEQVFVNNSVSYKSSRWFDLADVMSNVKADREGYYNSFVVIYK